MVGVFERYTEKARRAIFFARYEASSFGSPEITTEHLLLGVLREDHKAVSPAQERAFRARIEQEFPSREKISTSVDLPVSAAVKRAMANAAEAAGESGPIETEHLLIGITRETSSLAAKLLRKAGVAISLSQPPKIQNEFFRDLTRQAINGELNPLIGRETELARIRQVVSRRTRSNVALIGEAGVGKTAIVEGLAQEDPDRQVLLADALSLSAERLAGLGAKEETLLCIEGLFDLALAGSVWEATRALRALLSNEPVRVIGTGTPAGLRRTLETAPAILRYFEVIAVRPPDPDEAVKILNGLKTHYERFHGVVFGEGTIGRAVYASGRFLAHRSLPDRALDLIDEAGARAKLRKAETVTPADIDLVIADRTGAPLAAIGNILEQRGPGDLEQAVKALAAHFPIEGNEWVALLAAHIARSSPAGIEALVNAIRAISEADNLS